jgi:serine/threonine-protein kinase HipA
MQYDARLNALITLHAGLPRKGPGSDGLTAEIIDFLRPLLPIHPHVADLGCGNGRAALALAQALDARVTAVDICPDFIDELRDAIPALTSGHVEPRVDDMLEPDLERGTLDLIWSEGAAYAVGLENALDAWLPLMVPGGHAVLSECCWFTPDPPKEARDFWAEAYPDMGTQGDLLKRVEASGWIPLSLRQVPTACWWEDYYDPLIRRMDQLERAATGPMVEVMAETRREISLFRAHGWSYGYAVVVARTA